MDREETQFHQVSLDFNTQLILEERDASDSKRVKRSLILQGFPYQYSFYGQVRDLAFNKTYRRIEIFSNTELGINRLIELRQYFNENYPQTEYSIYVYNENKRGVQFVKGYGSKLR